MALFALRYAIQLTIKVEPSNRFMAEWDVLASYNATYIGIVTPRSFTYVTGGMTMTPFQGPENND